MGTGALLFYFYFISAKISTAIGLYGHRISCYTGYVAMMEEDMPHKQYAGFSR
jgi:hypothetical protein